MLHLASSTRFVQKSAPVDVVGRELAAENFERDCPAIRLRAGEEHLPHATFAQKRRDDVRGDTVAVVQGNFWPLASPHHGVP